MIIIQAGWGRNLGAMTDPGTAGTLPWRFDDLRALFINCTLKRSPEVSPSPTGTPRS